MTNDAPPPVQHSLRCICRHCVAGRQAELRRRLEEQRREERSNVLAYREELAGRGIVFAPKKPQPSPGSAKAIAKRYA